MDNLDGNLNALRKEEERIEVLEVKYRKFEEATEKIVEAYRELEDEFNILAYYYELEDENIEDYL